MSTNDELNQGNEQELGIKVVPGGGGDQDVTPGIEFPIDPASTLGDTTITQAEVMRLCRMTPLQGLFEGEDRPLTPNDNVITAFSILDARLNTYEGDLIPKIDANTKAISDISKDVVDLSMDQANIQGLVNQQGNDIKANTFNLTTLSSKVDNNTNMVGNAANRADQAWLLASSAGDKADAATANVTQLQSKVLDNGVSTKTNTNMINDLKSTISGVTDEIKGLTTDVSNAQTAVAKLSSDVSNMSSTVSDNKGTIVMLVNEFTDIRSKVNNNGAIAQDNAAKLVTIQKTLDNADGKFNTIDERFISVETEADQNKADITKNNMNISAVSSIANQTKSDLFILDQRVTTLESEINDDSKDPFTFDAIPTSFKGTIITVRKPNVRQFMWNGFNYVRAPWNQPGILKYSYHNPYSLEGHIKVTDDQEYKSSDYPELATILGVNGPTFKLIDARGKFIRSLNTGTQGIDANRINLSLQDDAIRNITGNIYGVVHVITGTDPIVSNGAFEQTQANVTYSKIPQMTGGGQSAYTHNFDASRADGVNVANEVRPINIAATLWVSY